MNIQKKGYNIAEVTTGVKLVAGESTSVGTKKDLDELRELVANSGLCRVKTVITVSGDDLNFDGVVSCNLCPNGFEFHTITYVSNEVTGGSPIIVGGQFYYDAGTTKCHVTAVPVSAPAAMSTRKSTSK